MSGIGVFATEFERCSEMVISATENSPLLDYHLDWIDPLAPMYHLSSLRCFATQFWALAPNLVCDRDDEVELSRLIVDRQAGGSETAGEAALRAQAWLVERQVV